MTTLGHGIEPVEGRAYTADFRVFGMFHLRRGVAFSRVLNMRDRPFLAVTECMVYREGYAYPPEPETLLYKTEFAALPKERLLWLVGGAAESAQERYGREPRQVCVMFPTYVIVGNMHMPPRVRISDHLIPAYAERPFQELFDASVLKPRPGASIETFEVVERHEFMTVNVARAGGLFDVANPIGRAFRTEGGTEA